MNDVTFSKQLTLGLLIVLAGFLCSSLFHNGIFSNIGLVLYGALFLFHPVYPAAVTVSPKHMRLAVRLAGGCMAVLGLFTRFGM